MARKTQSTNRNIYQEVTDAIVGQLAEGTVPWHRPWNVTGGVPRSMSTGKPYRGINPFLLSSAAAVKGYTSPWWGTFGQIKDRGGNVRKGERGQLVVFWKRLVVKTTDEERARTGKDTKVIPMLRHFVVFNADQADGLPEKYHPTPDAATEFDPIEEAELIVLGYDGPTIKHGGDAACYSPRLDVVAMPNRSQFADGDGYYSTLFHELTHSTGHASRLNRPGITEGHRFGDAAYSREELVAEMGAAMLAGVVGIHLATIPQHAAYIASWIAALRGDPKLLVQAAGQAQAAADLIRGITYSDTDEAPRELVTVG